MLKTQFFANISHEFRTPLTLMLGPIEDALSNVHGELPSAAADSLATSHRNALRLLKLVNALLDFSRIEAGRIQASYEPTDLCLLTTDLASNFRSLCEKAGLQLIVDCSAPTGEVAWVDRDMWEKIVLNLLSNAFKFTLHGEIEVGLAEVDGHARLRVRDTGVGIPPEELPRMFERFHRIEHHRGRTHEGTGIGLALVQELVKLHGGGISVTSIPGEGSTFTVTVPLGKTHLPADKVLTPRALAKTSSAPSAFVEEALRWLPDVSQSNAPVDRFSRPEEDRLRVEHDSSIPGQPVLKRANILWADDNADMRAYVSRLLSNRFDVEPVPDGEAAFAAALTHPPDLILADVMMPKLDGFGLLRAVRTDARLREIPVILLSARAGEESRIEGISAGADDYLVKPFSATELLARVETALRLKQIRDESRDVIRRSEARFRAFVTASSDVVYRMSPDWSEMRELQGRAFIDDAPDPGFEWVGKYIYAEDRELVLGAIGEAIRTKSVFELEHRVHRLDGSVGWTYSKAVPVLDANGEIVEWLGTAKDITARKREQDQIRDAAERLRFMADSMPQKVTTTRPDGSVDYMNARWLEFTGLSWEELRDWEWSCINHPDEVEENTNKWMRALVLGEPYTMTHRLRRADGEYRWHLSRAQPMRDQHGAIVMWIGSSTDIHDQKLTEQELRRANQALEQFAYSASHDLQEPLRTVKIYSELLSIECGDRLNGETLEYLAHVNSAAARMEILLRDLLEYTRASMMEKPSAAVDSADCFRAALANLKGANLEKGARVEVGALPCITAHVTHLQQLFQNLVGNAIKYSAEGVPPVIRVSAQRQADDWLFSVSDNGIGIEPEFKERIFGLFKRLHTNDQYSGTGIGLAICQRVVEFYDGRIWVESEPGKGSTFYFTLPG